MVLVVEGEGMGDEGRGTYIVCSSFHIMLLILPVMLFLFVYPLWSCFQPACTCSMLKVTF